MKAYLENNKLTLLIVLSAMILGIIIGSSSVARLTSDDATELYSAVNQSIDSTGLFAAFVKSITNEFKRFLILAFCGLTVFGSPVAVFYIGFTGYSLGFSVAFLLKYYGLSGILASLLGIIPHYLLLLPAYCFSGVISINFSNSILLNKRSSTDNLKLYIIKMLLIFTIIFFACVIEGFVSSFFLKQIIKLI